MNVVPFKTHTHCPKCTQSVFTRRYCADGFGGFSREMRYWCHRDDPNEYAELSEIPPHLRVSCMACGYVWHEQPADAEEEKT